ncbi:MAG: adenylate/guanylate cyclase domain-containing protein [Alphaproteobacteria bacterium]|nr:adenylate/guanylate cyclase domain-containing protein [Alphaproteobacteria bacterium]
MAALRAAGRQERAGEAKVVRRIRLVSGLILFSYLVTHFVNHSLGLVSLEAMDDTLYWIFRFWTSWPASTALYGAFLAHFALALYALWQRQTLRLGFAEAVQYTLGFLIPVILAEHVTTTRIADTFFGADFGYYRSLLTVYFHDSPTRGVLQGAVLVIAWVHACIGLRFWLRLKPWYETAQPYLFAFALLLPVFAMLGFLVAGARVAALAQDPEWVRQTFELRHRPPLPQQALLMNLIWALRLFFVASVGAVLIARIGRRRWQKRHGVSRVSYPDGRFIDVPRGVSILEASRMLGVPHASVCGGRGRCSTCRVRVQAPPAALPPAAPEEMRVLHRVHAGPGVRLACQLRPRGDIRVTPLLPPLAQARDGFARPGYLQGGEREIAILFADLRAFTKLAETRLPYDVVFVLNRYFAAMGEAVEEAGGYIDKFIGDGVMALFGIQSGAEAGCRQALAAARLISERLVELNRALVDDLETPLKIGIGLHFGPTIVGEIGYGKAISLTAVGDAVNTASRLEAAAKEYGCELVVSEDLVLRAGTDLTAFPRHEIAIRGRTQMLAVRTLDSARELPGARVAEKAGEAL